MINQIINLKNVKSYKNCVLTYGHFNSVHPGHIRYLKHAASKGKKLVVALINDKKNGKTQHYKFSQEERADSLKNFNFIDGIILLEDIQFTLINAIKDIKPDFLVLGKEFEKSNEEEIKEAVKLMTKNGKNTEFHGGEVQYASTQLLENSKNDLSLDKKNKFKSACARHKIELNNLIEDEKFAPHINELKLQLDSWLKNINDLGGIPEKELARILVKG